MFRLGEWVLDLPLHSFLNKVTIFANIQSYGTSIVDKVDADVSARAPTSYFLPIPSRMKSLYKITEEKYLPFLSEKVLKHHKDQGKGRNTMRSE